MNILIHPTYFPSIATFVAIAKASEVYMEIHDNFQKQTYRNRCYIYGANGKLALNIPVVHSQKSRQKYSDVEIFNKENWQTIHWKSILSAYRTSPFFEFYEDELFPLFEKPFKYLFDFNISCFKTVCECLQLNIKLSETISYEKKFQNGNDFRHLVKAKNEVPRNLESYIQVFSAKHGFIPNLSVLDLLFNEGPNALNYLENQNLELI